MICPNCGQWAPEQAQRCPNCQQPLDNVNASTISIDPWASTGATQAAWPAGNYAPGAPPAPPSRRRPAPTGGMIFALLLVALGAIGLIIFALLAGNVLNPHPARPAVAVAPTSTATPSPTPTVAPTATPMPTNTPVASTSVAISAGGQGSGPFSGDMDFNGGTPNSTTATIDTSGVTNPAPQSVYQNERYGSFSYTIPNLPAGAAYTVRLHFAEIFWTNAGQRQFNVAINNQQVLTNFDIIAAVGAQNKAIVKQFTTTVDNQGQITIAFSQGKANYPKVSGIEIVPNV